MDDRRTTPDAEEARRRARERLAARQGRIASEEGRRTGGERPDRASGVRRASSRRQPDRMEAGRSGIGGVLEAAFGAVSSAFAAQNRRLVVVALLCIIALAMLAVGVSSCVRGCSAEQVEGEEPVQSEQQETGEGAVPTPVSLPEGLDADLASSLEAAAAKSEDVAWIANHAADYAVDGDMVQYKLLKLAVEEPEAVAFVKGFPESYPADAATPYEGELQANAVPRLYQWDTRWGYTVYSSTTFALTGCCPTSLSMVYMGLTGKTDLTPYDMGLRAQSGGYMTEYNGTDDAFLVNEAASLGLACAEISVDSDVLRRELEDGKVVICNVSAGDFTTGGHYLVITSINDDGTLNVNDPYSAERSAKTWDVDQVVGQTKALFSYSLA